MSTLEAIDDYKPGGFHPVHLGDIFNDRYAVEHKLGHGGSSVVWLARDLQTNSCVALKILRADATVEMQQSDNLFLRHLNMAASPQSGWRSYLPAFLRQNGTAPASLFPRIIQDFMIHGPNGDHLCVVMEALGASLNMMLEFAEAADGGPLRSRLPLAARMTVAFQIAKGVAHLHDKGIVHGGKTPYLSLGLRRFTAHFISLDLHPNNIVFVLPGIESWTPDEVIAYLGKPIILEQEYWAGESRRGGEPVDEEGGVPRYLVFSPSDSDFWDLCIEKPDMPAIKIVCVVRD
jgi:serine/threonine-protein kinase SRPK3